MAPKTPRAKTTKPPKTQKIPEIVKLALSYIPAVLLLKGYPTPGDCGNDFDLRGLFEEIKRGTGIGLKESQIQSALKAQLRKKKNLKLKRKVQNYVHKVGPKSICTHLAHEIFKRGTHIGFLNRFTYVPFMVKVYEHFKLEGLFKKIHARLMGLFVQLSEQPRVRLIDGRVWIGANASTLMQVLREHVKDVEGKYGADGEWEVRLVQRDGKLMFNQLYFKVDENMKPIARNATIREITVTVAGSQQPGSGLVGDPTVYIMK